MAAEWGEPGWLDGQAQLLADFWALRTLMCPRAACRRRERCVVAIGACTLRVTSQMPDVPGALPLLRKEVEERVAEFRLDPEERAAKQAARDEVAERRRILAFKRARATLGIEGERKGMRRGGGSAAGEGA